MTKPEPQMMDVTSGVPLTPEEATLAANHVGYAESLARLVKSRLPRHVDVDELIGATYAKLLELVRRFDAGRGATFTSFAYLPLLGAAWDAARKLARHDRQVQRIIRTHRAHLEVGAAEGIAGPVAGETPEETFSRAVRSRVVVHMISQIPDEDDSMPEPFVDETSAAAHAQEREDASIRERVRARLRSLIARHLEAAEEKERLVIREVLLKGRTLDDVATELGGINKSNVARRLQKAVDRLAERLGPDLQAGDGYWATSPG